MFGRPQCSGLADVLMGGDSHNVCSPLDSKGDGIKIFSIILLSHEEE
jgi:hypothetical protein